MTSPSKTLPPLPSLSSNPIFAPRPSDPSVIDAPSQSLAGASVPFNVNGSAVPTSSSGYAPRTPGTSEWQGERGSTPPGAGAHHAAGVSASGPQSQSQAAAAATDWELAYERGQEERWGDKVREDLRGWRGGHGVKRSMYSRQALPEHSYFHQPITGDVVNHLPKEIIRIERDWSDGEVCQFESSFPMELDSRITPQQFTSFINLINGHLVAAYSVRGAVIDNMIAIATWWTSLMWRDSTSERELQKVEQAIQRANEEMFNPAGLNVLSPRDVALQFLEIEFY